MRSTPPAVRHIRESSGRRRRPGHVPAGPSQLACKQDCGPKSRRRISVVHKNGPDKMLRRGHQLSPHGRERPGE